MWFSEYIFLERRWTKDENALKSGLQRLNDFPRPFWLALFVEGTRFTQSKITDAHEYAASARLPVPRNVLIPCTKGIVTAVYHLRSFVPAIYNVTVAIPKEELQPTMLRMLRGRSSTGTPLNRTTGDLFRYFFRRVFSVTTRMEGISNDQMVCIRDVVMGIGLWAVKVMVQEKACARLLQDTGLLCQNVLLVDAEAVTVRMLIEGDQVARFADSLRPFSYYFISAAKIQELDVDGVPLGYGFSWIVTPETKIVRCHEVPRKSFCTLSLTPFKYLNRNLDTMKPVDILALVIGISRKRKILIDGKMVRVRQILLIDRNALPIYLILRDGHILVEAAEIEKLKPAIDSPIVVVATGVFVSSIAGFSICLEDSSCLMINPHLEQAQRLFIWAMQNERLIRGKARVLAVKPYTEQKPRLSKKNAISVSDVLRKSEMVGVSWLWVYASASLQHSVVSPFYMACSECTAGIDVAVSGFYFCQACDRKSFVRPRARLRIKVSDASGSMFVLVEGRNAEALFDFSAYSLLKNRRKGIGHALHKTVKRPDPPPELIQLMKKDSGFVVTYVASVADYIYAEDEEEVPGLLDSE